MLEVPWGGPNNEGDCITLVPAAFPEGEYETYVYTKDGNPARIQTPYKSGDFEVRYQSDGGNRVFARAGLKLTAPQITLSDPEEVAAGTELEVVWTGPNNEHDYITIVPSAASPGEYMNYIYSREGSPLRLTAPEEAGAYELRY